MCRTRIGASRSQTSRRPHGTTTWTLRRPTGTNWASIHSGGVNAKKGNSDLKSERSVERWLGVEIGTPRTSLVRTEAMFVQRTEARDETLTPEAGTRGYLPATGGPASGDMGSLEGIGAIR